MDRAELIQQIKKSEKMFDRRKTKRNIYTLLFYIAVSLQIFYWQDQFGHSFLDILGAVLACVLISFIAFLINTVIFHHLITKSQAEEKALEYLRKQLEEKEDKHNY